MKSLNPKPLIPSLIIAGGIILATYVSRSGHPTGWKIPAATALMAFSLIGADALQAFLLGGRVAVSLSSVLLGSGFVLAGIICREPALTSELITTLAGIGWVLFISPARIRNTPCHLR